MYELKNKNVSVGFAGISQTISGPISDELHKVIVKRNPKAAELFQKVADAPADIPGESVSVDPQVKDE